MDGEDVSAVDQRGDRGWRQRGHNVSGAIVSWFRRSRTCDTIVRHFARGDIITADFDAVDPRDETIIALGIKEEVRDVAAILDGELVAEIDRGVVAQHVAQQRARDGRVRVGIAEEEWGRGVGPTGIVKVELAPGVGRVGGFFGAFHETPNRVRLQQHFAGIQCEIPGCPCGSAIERIGNLSLIKDIVVGCPGDVHSSGGRLRNVERVGRAAAAHIERWAAVHQQVGCIHTGDRFAEGDSDLLQVRDC